MQCSGITKKGERCKHVRKSGWCADHAPKLYETRKIFDIKKVAPILEEVQTTNVQSDVLFRAAPYNYLVRDNYLIAPDLSSSITPSGYLAKGSPSKYITLSAVLGVAAHYHTRVPGENRPVFVSMAAENRRNLVLDFNTKIGVDGLGIQAYNNGNQDAEVLFEKYVKTNFFVDFATIHDQLTWPFPEGSSSLREFHVKNRVPGSTMRDLYYNHSYDTITGKQVDLPAIVQKVVDEYYNPATVAIVNKNWHTSSAPRVHKAFCKHVRAMLRTQEDAPIPIPGQEADRLAKNRKGTKVCKACQTERTKIGKYNLKKVLEKECREIL